MATGTLRVVNGDESERNKQTGEGSEKLMNMIFQYLDQESPNSPYYSPKQEPALPQVKQWRAQLGEIESPVLGNVLPTLKLVEDSASTKSKSPTGSMFSGSEGVASTRASSIESVAGERPGSKGGETSTASIPSRKPSTINDPETHMLATITDLTELLPEYMPEFTPSPETPIHKEVSPQHSIKNRPEPKHASMSRHQNPTPNFSLLMNNGPANPTIPIMDRARTLPRHSHAPASKPPPTLKINTDLARPKPNCLVVKGLRDKNGQPVQVFSRKEEKRQEEKSPERERQRPRSEYPELEFKKPVLPTLLQITHLNGPHAQNKHTLRITNPDPVPNSALSPLQQAPLQPPLNKGPFPTEFKPPPPTRRPSALTTLRKSLLKPLSSHLAPAPVCRHSEFIPSPSRKLLGNLEKHDQEWSRLSMREMPPSHSHSASSSPLKERDRNHVLLASKREPPASLRAGKNPNPRPRTADATLTLTTATAPIPRKATHLPVSLGIETRFLTSPKGLQMRMSRKVTSAGLETMEWDIFSTSAAPLLKCFHLSNSLSLRKDFLDAEGRRLFTFQRRIGSTRVAETKEGDVLFTVRNGSLCSIPHWTIVMGDGMGKGVEWVAKGDRNMNSLTIVSAGVEIARITVEGKNRMLKHCYNVIIAPATNFCVVAAMVAVFDDLRVDILC